MRYLLAEYRHERGPAASPPAARADPAGGGGRPGARASGHVDAGATAPRPRHVAYLTNVYPGVSHSFIRREILALEARGLRVSRFSIRRAPADLPDPDDQAERARTTVLLDTSPIAFARAAAGAAVRHPAGLLAALRMARAMSRRSSAGLVRHLAYLVEACVLVRAARRSGFRHVHVHFGTNPAAVARLARAIGGIGYSMTIHGPDEFDAPAALSLPAKIADAAFTVAISNYGRGQLMRWSDRADWAKLHVVRCGLDAPFLDGDAPAPAAGSGGGPPRFVCVARLDPQKGLSLLLDAAARVAATADFEIHIIGDGPMRGELAARIVALGLEPRVTLLGWRSAAEVRAEIGAARALILSSFAEGLPIVLMEAMALGRPVIATAVGGIAELVDHSCGWLVPAGSVGAMAGAMLAALDADATARARTRARGARNGCWRGTTRRPTRSRWRDCWCSMVEGLAWAAAALLTLPAFVFALECLAGAARQSSDDETGEPPPFAVLIPAHDEELGIAATVVATRAQLRDCDRILVVADNCTDATASLAAAVGAEVVCRTDPIARGKGHALAAGRAVLRAAPPAVVIVLDADCEAAPGALATIAAVAARDTAAVQGLYLMAADARRTTVSAISTFAFAVKNQVRQRGLRALGAPALLQGSGMAFAWDVFATAPIASGEIAEDLELGLELAMAGVPIRFVERAAFRSDECPNWALASQRTRWEHGSIALARRYVPRLALRVLAGRGALLPLMLNLTVPPLALLLTLMLGLTAGAVLAGATGLGWAMALWMGAVLALVAVAVVASWVRFGRALLPFATLRHVPRYLWWKLPIYARLFGRQERRWVRTARKGVP